LARVSTLVKSTINMVGSGAVAQAIQLAGLIVLTQHYAVGAFGDLTLAINMTALSAVAFGLQLHLAIPSVQADEEVQDIAAAVFFNATSLGLITIPIVAFFNGVLAIGLALGIFVCLSNVGRAMLIRAGNSRTLAITNLCRAIVILTSQFLLADLSPYGLLIGLVVGEGCISAFLFLNSGQSINNLTGYSIAKYKKALSFFSDFSFWGTLQEFVSVAVVFIPFYICSVKYSDAVLGNFGMVYRVTWAPMVIIAVGLGWAILGEIGKTPENFRKSLKEIYYTQFFILAAIVSVTAFFLLPNLLNIYIGAEWSIAAEISPVVLAAAMVFLVSSPFRQLIRILRKQKWQLGIDFGTLTVICMISIFDFKSAIHWIYAISVATIIQNFVMIGCGWLALQEHTGKAISGD